MILAELPTIPLSRLAIAMIPVALVIGIHWRWSLGPAGAVYAVGRMLLQLLLIGYVLTAIFETRHSGIVLLVLTVMLLIASWISLRTVEGRSLRLYGNALLAIVIGGVTTLLLVTQGVLTLEPWFAPRYMIPLAGMIFSNSMNAVSLAAERFESEQKNDHDYLTARNTALRAALIPITNALLSVGLVAIPGMMTGQVLSGIDPLIAARYQIMVMAMVYGSAGLSGACYLWLIRPKT